MWGDIAQVILGGVTSGASKIGEVQDQSRRQAQALEIAKIKKNDDLVKAILTSLAGAAGQEMAKSGMYPNTQSIGDLLSGAGMEGYEKPVKLLQAIFGQQGDYLPGREPRYLPSSSSGGGGGLPKSKIFSRGQGGGWVDPMATQSTPMVAPQKKAITPEDIKNYLNR